MTNKNNQSKSKTFSSFTVPTLLKLVAIEAEQHHGGKFTILADGDEYRAAFGQGAPSQAASVSGFGSLKEALVALLVDAPAFAESEFVTELPIQ